MNKFTVSNIITPEGFNNDLPVIYKVFFGDNDRYYIHKGKRLDESLKNFLYAIDRGIRGGKVLDEFNLAVKYLKAYPAIHKVKVEVVFNGEPEKVLSKEKALLKVAYKDINSFNDQQFKPYTPQWLEKITYKCDEGECLQAGTVGNKKQKFKFCPNCGNRN